VETIWIGSTASITALHHDYLPRSYPEFYGMEDIATELIVVDSLGQRLTLHIDNVLGRGGQHRVTLYAPFWIVSATTVHFNFFYLGGAPF
jgi:hypothetical protein